MTVRARRRIRRTTYRALLILVGVLAGFLLQRVLRPEGPRGAAQAGLAPESPEVPAATTDLGDELTIGFSLEDPVASLAFLTRRIEKTRVVAETELRRAEETRREAARLARRFDYGAPPPDAPSGYTNLELGLNPGGVSTQDARASALALSPSEGVRAPNGGPSADARASTRSPSEAPENGVRRVPLPPSRGSSRSSGVLGDPSPGPEVGRVTIGEPMQDLPPSTAMLARAAGPTRGASTPQTAPSPPPRRRPTPPPPDSDYEAEEEEPESLIGPERAPVLEPAALVARGAVVLRTGRLRITPAFSFSFSDRAQITTQGIDVGNFLFIGQIFSGQVRSSALTSAITVRYGLLDRLSLRATFPYRYRKTENFSANLAQEVLPRRLPRKSTSHAMGDITLGAGYQLYRSDSRLPSIVGNFSYSIDTGTPPAGGRGTHRVSLGLTFVTRSDPASLFGSVSYLHTIGEFRNFQRGDMVGASVGFSYALNYDLSLSTSFNFLREIEDSRIRGRPGLDSRFERRTTVASLGFGINYGLTNRMGLSVTLGAGLTDDTPELTLSVGLPMVFDTSGWW